MAIEPVDRRARSGNGIRRFPGSGQTGARRHLPHGSGRIEGPARGQHPCAVKHRNFARAQAHIGDGFGRGPCRVVLRFLHFVLKQRRRRGRLREQRFVQSARQRPRKHAVQPRRQQREQRREASHIPNCQPQPEASNHRPPPAWRSIRSLRRAACGSGGARTPCRFSPAAA